MRNRGGLTERVLEIALILLMSVIFYVAVLKLAVAVLLGGHKS